MARLLFGKMYAAVSVWDLRRVFVRSVCHGTHGGRRHFAAALRPKLCVHRRHDVLGYLQKNGQLLARHGFAYHPQRGRTARLLFHAISRRGA